MPTCIECGKEVPGTEFPGQDNSTFVCESCQDAKNLKTWKEELKTLKGLGNKATSSQLDRLSWIENKIKQVEQE